MKQENFSKKKVQMHAREKMGWIVWDCAWVHASMHMIRSLRARDMTWRRNGSHLHDVTNPDAAVDGVHADDGGRRLPADAEEQPRVVPGHHRQPQRHQHVVQLFLLHSHIPPSPSPTDVRDANAITRDEERRKTTTETGSCRALETGRKTAHFSFIKWAVLDRIAGPRPSPSRRNHTSLLLLVGLLPKPFSPAPSALLRRR